MKDFIKVTKALSDHNRVKILKILQRRPLCVGEIQAALGIAQPTVSKHLKVIKEAGLVKFEKDGLWVKYRLTDGSRSPYAAALLGNLRHWLEDSPEIATLVQRLPSIHRRNISRK